MGWLRKLVDWIDPPQGQSKPHPSAHVSSDPTLSSTDAHGARIDAKNRLKFVLMNDRTQLSPAVLEQMRDDMVEVISRYVEIDRDALEVNLENESNTIALVASIPVLRARAV
jgi:cell division topological specificity factor